MKITSREYTKGLWGVFSSAAFCIYSWSMFIFFWQVPSLLLRFSPEEIVGYVAYQLLFALAESIIVTLLIASLSLILPAKFIRNNLRVTGTVLFFAFAINSIILKELIRHIVWLERTFQVQGITTTQIVAGTWIVCLVLLIIGVILIAKSENMKQAIDKFVENLSVLVSLYVILSVLGIILVIIRNLF